MQHGVDVDPMRGGRDGHAGAGPGADRRAHRSTTAPYDLVRKMRASVLVLGPLVARCGEARVSLPGGCAIGTRPVDLHIKGLQRLGAEVELQRGLYRGARAARACAAPRSSFPTVSVGATENLLMAATLAEGETVLVNAAREPEIVDLAHCLNAMGARDRGHRHRPPAHPRRRRACTAPTHTIIPDRIETGTYMMAAAITGGEVELVGARLDLVAAVARDARAAPASRSPTTARRAVGAPAQRAPRRRRRDDRAVSRVSRPICRRRSWR